MIVLDASAVLELLLATPAGRAVDLRLRASGEEACAPHVLDLEVAQVLRGLVARRELAPARADQAVDDLARLPVVRWPDEALLPRVWSLRQGATAYDATYLALAEALDAVLLTSDRRMAEIPGHEAVVELV